MQKTLFILTVLFFINSNAQNNNPFIGNWIWKNNNKIFSVHFYEEGKIVKGDYRLVKINNDGEEQVVYESNKLINKEFDMYYGHTINGSSDDGILFDGVIRDNVLYGDKIHAERTGELTLHLKNEDTLVWKVNPLTIYDKKRKLIIPENFSVPTNIVLIKEGKEN